MNEDKVVGTPTGTSGTSTRGEPDQRLPWYTRFAPAGWMVVGLLAAAGYLLVGQVGGEATDSANRRTDTVQQQALQVANPVDQLCAEGGATAAELDRRGACSPARSIVQAPPTASAVRAPTREEVRAAVADYLRRFPPPAGRSPTTEDITAAVASYLAAHPPTPGRPPTAAEITAAVQAYLAVNPPAPGKDAPAPTDEQIAAAVASYLEAHPPASGERGSDGASGKPPASWTWTGQSGAEHVCTRSNADDSNPTYSCNTIPPADSPAPPSTTDGGGLLDIPTG